MDSGLWSAATYAPLKAQPSESTFFRRLGIDNAIAAKRFYIAFQLKSWPLSDVNFSRKLNLARSRCMIRES